MSEPSLAPYARPAVVTALIAVLLGIFVSALLGLVMWAGAQSGSPSASLVIGLHGWLFAHGSGLAFPDASVELVPLGASAAVGALIFYVARKVVVDGVRQFFAFGFVTAALYAALVVLAAILVPKDSLAFALEKVAAGAFALALVASTAGAASRAGAGAAWWSSQDARLRSGVRGAAVTLTVLFVVALTLVTSLLLTHRNTAGDLWSSLDVGFVGGVGVVLSCLAVLPNLLLWSLAVLLGPGFSLGVDTAVTLDSAQLGALPGLPILAALPAGGPFAGWVFVLAAVPVLAGAAGGVRGSAGQRWETSLTAVAIGAAGGAAAGLVLGMALAVSGGAVGPGRMAESGPPVMLSLVLAPVILAVGGALGALVGHYRVFRAPADE